MRLGPDIGVPLESSDCAVCGVVFAMPARLEQKRRDDNDAFYCPNGHQLYFKASTADMLRKELEQEKQRTQFAREERDRAREERARLERRITSLRGVITRLKRKGGALLRKRGGGQ